MGGGICLACLLTWWLPLAVPMKSCLGPCSIVGSLAPDAKTHHKGKEEGVGESTGRAQSESKAAEGEHVELGGER